MRRAGIAASQDTDVGLVLQDIPDCIVRPRVAGGIPITVCVQIICDLLYAITLVDIFCKDKADDLGELVNS